MLATQSPLVATRSRLTDDARAEAREQREQRLAVLLAERRPDPADREQRSGPLRVRAQHVLEHRIRGDRVSRLALGTLEAPLAQALELLFVDRRARRLG